MSHHLGRWRLEAKKGPGVGTSNLARLEQQGDHIFKLNIIHGGKPFESCDPDTSRIWWDDVGVHQNLTHAVHPDPLSGAHCWRCKKHSTSKSPRQRSTWRCGGRHGKVHDGLSQWGGQTRSVMDHSPDGLRRPFWQKRPLKPTKAAYKITFGAVWALDCRHAGFFSIFTSGRQFEARSVPRFLWQLWP